MAWISQVRRILRSACGKLKAVNTGAENGISLLTQAKVETERGLDIWKKPMINFYESEYEH